MNALGQAGGELKNARVVVLGYSYLEDSADTRNSPSHSLVARLEELGAIPVIHDPWIAEYAGDVIEKIKNCDAIIVMVAHSDYRRLDLKAIKSVLRLPILIDGRNVYDPAQAREAGLIYFSVGLGNNFRNEFYAERQ